MLEGSALFFIENIKQYGGGYVLFSLSFTNLGMESFSRGIVRVVQKNKFDKGMCSTFVDTRRALVGEVKKLNC